MQSMDIYVSETWREFRNVFIIVSLFFVLLILTLTFVLETNIFEENEHSRPARIPKDFDQFGIELSGNKNFHICGYSSNTKWKVNSFSHSKSILNKHVYAVFRLIFHEIWFGYAYVWLSWDLQQSKRSNKKTCHERVE